MRRTVVGLLLALALPLTASAQSGSDTRGFATFSGGFQGTDGASTQSGTFTAYGESGNVKAEQAFDGGGLFWFGGGFKIAGNLAVGAAYSRVTDTQSGTVTVTAPHPLIFDAPRTATLEQGGLKHNENVFHLQALYVIPASEKFEVILSGGPSFFTVTHDFVTGASFSEVGSPYSSINITNVQVTEADKTVTGINVGAEAAFYFTRNIGVGGFFRYAAASAELEVGSGTTQEIDLGGPQYGFGVRFRF
jgi:hypothetical protein